MRRGRCSSSARRRREIACRRDPTAASRVPAQSILPSCFHVMKHNSHYRTLSHGLENEPRTPFRPSKMHCASASMMPNSSEGTMPITDELNSPCPGSGRFSCTITGFIMHRQSAKIEQAAQLFLLLESTISPSTSLMVIHLEGS